MTLYGGIDLHANNSLMALLDDHDKIVFEKQVPNEITTILAHLVPYHARLVGFVVESTSNWYGLVDGLLVTGSDAAAPAKPMGSLSCPGVDPGSCLGLGRDVGPRELYRGARRLSAQWEALDGYGQCTDGPPQYRSRPLGCHLCWSRNR